MGSDLEAVTLDYGQLFVQFGTRRNGLLVEPVPIAW